MNCLFRSLVIREGIVAEFTGEQGPESLHVASSIFVAGRSQLKFSDAILLSLIQSQ
ncbi:MAG: hypothetical protein QOG23_449 [Blastocatellia bacterium]|jgi:hypothetical protein|nr:hypothetical protein [Blastocatellia bacterium]